jgi:hypothetical protein
MISTVSFKALCLEIFARNKTEKEFESWIFDVSELTSRQFSGRAGVLEVRIFDLVRFAEKEGILNKLERKEQIRN